MASSSEAVAWRVGKEAFFDLCELLAIKKSVLLNVDATDEEGVNYKQKLRDAVEKLVTQLVNDDKFTNEQHDDAKKLLEQLAHPDVAESVLIELMDLLVKEGCKHYFGTSDNRGHYSYLQIKDGDGKSPYTFDVLVNAMFRLWRNDNEPASEARIKANEAAKTKGRGNYAPDVKNTVWENVVRRDTSNSGSHQLSKLDRLGRIKKNLLQIEVVNGSEAMKGNEGKGKGKEEAKGIPVPTEKSEVKITIPTFKLKRVSAAIERREEKTIAELLQEYPGAVFQEFTLEQGREPETLEQYARRKGNENAALFLNQKKAELYQLKSRIDAGDREHVLAFVKKNQKVLSGPLFENGESLLDYVKRQGSEEVILALKGSYPAVARWLADEFDPKTGEKLNQQIDALKLNNAPLPEENKRNLRWVVQDLYKNVPAAGNGLCYLFEYCADRLTSKESEEEEGKSEKEASTKKTAEELQIRLNLIKTQVEKAAIDKKGIIKSKDVSGRDRDRYPVKFCDDIANLSPPSEGIGAIYVDKDGRYKVFDKEETVHVGILSGQEPEVGLNGQPLPYGNWQEDLNDPRCQEDVREVVLNNPRFQPEGDLAVSADVPSRVLLWHTLENFVKIISLPKDKLDQSLETEKLIRRLCALRLCVEREAASAMLKEGKEKLQVAEKKFNEIELQASSSDDQKSKEQLPQCGEMKKDIGKYNKKLEELQGKLQKIGVEDQMVRDLILHEVIELSEQITALSNNVGALSIPHSLSLSDSISVELNPVMQPLGAPSFDDSSSSLPAIDGVVPVLSASSSSSSSSHSGMSVDLTKAVDFSSVLPQQTPSLSVQINPVPQAPKSLDLKPVDTVPLDDDASFSVDGGEAKGSLEFDSVSEDNPESDLGLSSLFKINDSDETKLDSHQHSLPISEDDIETDTEVDEESSSSEDDTDDEEDKDNLDLHDFGEDGFELNPQPIKEVNVDDKSKQPENSPVKEASPPSDGDGLGKKEDKLGGAGSGEKEVKSNKGKPLFDSEKMKKKGEGEKSDEDGESELEKEKESKTAQKREKRERSERLNEKKTERSKSGGDLSSDVEEPRTPINEEKDKMNPRVPEQFNRSKRPNLLSVDDTKKDISSEQSETGDETDSQSQNDSSLAQGIEGTKVKREGEDDPEQNSDNSIPFATGDSDRKEEFEEHTDTQTSEDDSSLNSDDPQEKPYSLHLSSSPQIFSIDSAQQTPANAQHTPALDGKNKSKKRDNGISGFSDEGVDDVNGPLRKKKRKQNGNGASDGSDPLEDLKERVEWLKKPLGSDGENDSEEENVSETTKLPEEQPEDEWTNFGDSNGIVDGWESMFESNDDLPPLPSSISSSAPSASAVREEREGRSSLYYALEAMNNHLKTLKGYEHISLPELEACQKQLSQIMHNNQLKVGEQILWQTLNPNGNGEFKAQDLLPVDQGGQGILAEAIKKHKEQYLPQFRDVLKEVGGRYEPEGQKYYFQRTEDNRIVLKLRKGETLNAEELRCAFRELAVICEDMRSIAAGNHNTLKRDIHIHQSSFTENPGNQKEIAMIVKRLGLELAREEVEEVISEGSESQDELAESDSESEQTRSREKKSTVHAGVRECLDKMKVSEPATAEQRFNSDVNAEERKKMLAQYVMMNKKGHLLKELKADETADEKYVEDYLVNIDAWEVAQDWDYLSALDITRSTLPAAVKAAQGAESAQEFLQEKVQVQVVPLDPELLGWLEQETESHVEEIKQKYEYYLLKEKHHLENLERRKQQQRECEQSQRLETEERPQDVSQWCHAEEGQGQQFGLGNEDARRYSEPQQGFTSEDDLYDEDLDEQSDYLSEGEYPVPPQNSNQPLLAVTPRPDMSAPEPRVVLRERGRGRKYAPHPRDQYSHQSQFGTGYYSSKDYDLEGARKASLQSFSEETARREFHIPKCELARVPGDGDCFYSAVAHQLLLTHRSLWPQQLLSILPDYSESSYLHSNFEPCRKKYSDMLRTLVMAKHSDHQTGDFFDAQQHMKTFLEETGLALAIIDNSDPEAILRGEKGFTVHYLDDQGDVAQDDYLTNIPEVKFIVRLAFDVEGLHYDPVASHEDFQCGALRDAWRPEFQPSVSVPREQKRGERACSFSGDHHFRFLGHPKSSSSKRPTDNPSNQGTPVTM
jgi:hypothetical protein